ncbi:MAG: 3-hydroxyacyl-CoA dehydrogenase family protein [Gammaproteobacteria bacterium]
MEKGKIVVVGSGTIGTSLAFVSALYGWNTCLVGRRQQSIDIALENCERSYRELADAELLPDKEAEKWRERMHCSVELSDFCHSADIVLEAVSEDLDVKQNLFCKLEEVVQENCLLASSTSGLPVDGIVNSCKYRDRVGVAHFANPPHLMPTVEVVPGTHTSGETMNQLCSYVKSLGKTPIRLKKDLPGHLFNRIQFAMLREAMALVRDNVAEPEDIDNVVKQGLALRLAAEGPLQKMDLATLDLVCSVSEYLFPELDASKEPEYLRQMLAQGYHGSKSGRGFYEWTGEEADAVIAERNQEVIRHLKRMRSSR